MNKTELKNLIETYPKHVTNLRSIIKKYIGTCLTKYPLEWPLFQKAFHELYLEGSAIPVLCPVCRTNPLRFIGLRNGYTQNCSASCRNRNPEFLKKYKETCLVKYETEFASQSTKFKNTVKNTCIEKYGVDSVMKVDEIKGKLKEVFFKKYGVDNPSKLKEVIAKIKKSRISTGDWTADEDKTDLEKYRLEVKKISAKSYHNHYYKINPGNLPRSRYKYHLDHIFSVEEGFKQGVSPEVIGHWSNLQMLWHLDNSIKNIKCHKTLEQLMEDYNKTRSTLGE